jgi:hypothetical protein
MTFQALSRCFAEDPAFLPACIEFFSHHSDELLEIFTHANKGRLVETFVHDLFGMLKRKFDDPERGVKAIIDLGIPLTRYRQFSEFNSFLNPATQTWEPIYLFGVRFPNIWPSYKKVYGKWEEMKNSLQIRSVPDLDFHAGFWPVDQCLEFVLASPFYSRFFEHKNYLELLLRGDEFIGLGESDTFFIISFGNFGIYSKCILFNFLINLAFAKETETEKIRAGFRYSFLCRFRFLSIFIN